MSPLMSAPVDLSGLLNLLTEAGAPFRDKVAERGVPRDVAMAAAHAIVSLTHQDVFRALGPWERFRQAHRKALSPVASARWSVGFGPESGVLPNSGYRCFVRVQLPFHVTKRAIREAESAFHRAFGRFVSFRWSSTVATCGVAPRPARREMPLRIGSSLGVIGGDVGSLGLLLRHARRDEFFAVTAGHVALGARASVPLDTAALSTAFLDDPGRGAHLTLAAASTLPRWRAGHSDLTVVTSDLALFQVDDPRHPQLRADQIFDRRRLSNRGIVEPPKGDTEFERGLRLAKAGAQTQYCDGAVEAAQTGVEIEDAHGRHLWATGVVEVALDGNATCEPGDSGGLVVANEGEYLPFGIVIARGLIRAADAGARSVPTLYVEPLWSSWIFKDRSRTLKVL
jgi:hypothetical protein